MQRLIAFALFGALLSGPAHGLRTPDPGKDDVRMATADYRAGEVYAVHVPQGMTMAIRLADDEVAGQVFGADKTTLRASLAGNTVIVWSGEAIVTPRSLVIIGRKPNGTQRTYTLLVDTRPLEQAHLGLRFNYPEDEKARQLAVWRAAAAKRAEAEAAAAAAAAVDDMSRDTNKKYDLQGETAGDWNLLPTRKVSDNGNSTHFAFPGNMRVPLIYEITEDGKEQIAEPTFNAASGVATVHRVAKRWKLLGDGGSVLCVFNLAYDPIGVKARSGTASPDIERVLK